MSTNAAYDHERTITALFDTRAAAEKAKTDVIAAGVPSDRISIIEGEKRTTAGTLTTDHRDAGFWQSLKDLFVPEEDRTAYAEGLSRGGFLLSAKVTQTNYERVLEVLDHDGAVNLDERESEWRKEGWSGSTAAGTATGIASKAALGTDGYREPTGSTGATGVMASSQATTGRQATGALGSSVAGAEGVIPIAEENLRVGKRDVSHGRVRLRSYVVEKPVSESIELHSEKVDVSRRPVDRALGVGENLFVDRTIEAEEHSEEAVVSKDVRVVEEVSLNRVAQDRVQEIHDTLRRTEVEVDDGRGVEGGRVGAVSGASGFASAIAEHMPVVSSNGTRIGTVDRLDGERIKLTKNDSPDGQHHYVPLSWVSRVADGVHLDRHENDVRSGWKAA